MTKVFLSKLELNNKTANEIIKEWYGFYIALFFVVLYQYIYSIRIYAKNSTSELNILLLTIWFITPILYQYAFQKKNNILLYLCVFLISTSIFITTYTYFYFSTFTILIPLFSLLVIKRKIQAIDHFKNHKKNA